MQCLINLYSLSFLKFVLLLKTVVGYHLMVNTIVKLAIIIELILAVNLSTLLGES